MAKELRLDRRTGISSLVVGLVVTIVVASAGIGFYTLTMRGPSAADTNSSTIASTSSSTHSTAYSTSSSPTSASSTSTSTASTASSTSTTCTSTTLTTTSSGSQTNIAFVYLFGNYSSMTVTFRESFSFGDTSGSLNGTSTYSVLQAWPNAYKVNVTNVWSTTAFGTTTITTTTANTVWLQKDGTLVAIYSSGQNSTGFEAEFGFAFAMLGFIFTAEFTPTAFPAFNDSSYVHVESSGVEMLGPTEVSYTTYVPNSLPLVWADCTGISMNLSVFSFQTGTVAGKSLGLTTSLLMKGTITSPYLSESSLDLEVDIDSITTA